MSDASVASFLVCYLLNQWCDFDQTCIDKLHGGMNELISFGGRYLIGTLKFQILTKKDFRTLSLDLESGRTLYCLCLIVA